MDVKPAQKTPKAKGRPRNEQTKQAILGAALELALERGYPGVTLQDVAARANTSRQTIYRWWPTLPDLYIEVIVGQIQQISTPESVTADLEEYLSALFAFQGGKIGAIIMELIVDCGSRSRVAAAFRPLLAMRLKRLETVIEGFAAAQGAALIVPVSTVAQAIAGAMWYRSLHQNAPLDAAFAKELTALASSLLTKDSLA